MMSRPRLMLTSALLFLQGAVLIGCGGRQTDGVDASFIHLPGEGEAQNAPRMQWSTTELDLGLVAAGESRELTYELTNAGRSPLIVTQVLPSCGCTVAEAWDASPSPPAHPPIVLRFDAGETTRTLSESATVGPTPFPAPWNCASPQRYSVRTASPTLNHDPHAPHPR